MNEPDDAGREGRDRVEATALDDYDSKSNR